jgi:predicted secreted acid phosphatase
MRGAAGIVLVAALCVLASCGDDSDDDALPAPPATGTWSVGQTGGQERWPGDNTNQQPDPVDPEQANLTEIKNELKEYHDDGLYEQDLLSMAVQAQECMLEAATDAERPALVLDIDETALSNYEWMVEVDFLRGSPMLADLFAAHADEANSPPIEPVLDLYEAARDNDIAVFFITGRREPLREVTEENLRNAGYDDFEQVYFAPPEYDDPSIVPFKSGVRADIEEQGYTIVANVGDQDSDLDGGHGGCPHKLPDPYYFIP